VGKGFTVWFTGLSGSGKTAISKFVEKEILKQGREVEVLDGDVVRTHISKGLGFSKEDRDAHISRLGWLASRFSHYGVPVITAAISPYKDIRNNCRQMINSAGGIMVEVYCECDLDTLMKRDVKGLYKKAMAGEIKNFTGVSDPYEPPDNPEVVCYTAKETVEESAQKVIDKLYELGCLKKKGEVEEPYSEEEKKEIDKRLEALGYL
jgi:adenylylsulfate kinase